MKNFTNDMNFASLSSSQDIVFIQFGRKSCTPCASIRLKIRAWLKENTGVAGFYIDVEDFPKLAAQGGVFSVPSVQVYFEGKLIIERSGYFSLEEIFANLERYRELRTKTVYS